MKSPGFQTLHPSPLPWKTAKPSKKMPGRKPRNTAWPLPNEIVVADDSGLEVDALHGAPGVHSARYAADEPHLADSNTDDEANNARVLRELAQLPPEKRTGRFVCVLAAARNGKTLAIFRGTAEGIILDAPRGNNGFGYDPLVLLSPDPQDLRRTEPRGKVPLQPSWVRIPPVSRLV